MGKNFTGAGDYIDSVFAEGGGISITAVFGETRATSATLADLYEAMAPAGMVDFGVDMGTATIAVSSDEDEGLREGLVFGGGLFDGGGPMAGIVSRADLEATPPVAELTRRKALAEALIAECKAAELACDDTIKRSNADESVPSEYEPDGLVYGHILIPSGPVARVHASSDDLERIEAVLREVTRLSKASEKAHARAHEAEVLLEKSRRRVAILERAASAEFEWEGSVDVGTHPLSPMPVRVRSTEAGILALEEGVQHMRETIARADEAAVRRLRVQGSIDDSTTYTVRSGDASMTVTGSASGVASLVKLAYGGFEYGVSA